jgi:glycosyltransferase involved in cell wall biosynthesis
MYMNLLFVTHHRRLRLFARGDPWARELTRRGYAVTVMCISQSRRFRLLETRSDGVLYVEVPDLLPGILRSGWDPWDTLRRILYLRGKRFDLIHAFETRPATIYPVLSMLREARVPLVIDWIDWWGRGGLIKDRRPGWYRVLFGAMETWYEEHFRTRADHSTVISSALARRTVGLGVPPDCVTVIHGGVDPQFFRVQPSGLHRARFGLPANSFLAYFSALDAVMDLQLVLTAFKRALAGGANMLLVMTGHMPTRFDWHVQRVGLAGRIRHLGYLPYHELPNALSCADVFLLPFSDTVSNRGRWPHKVGDYMACGRPTVSNPVGDIRGLFERERVGLLADPTPEAMAEAIVRLHDDPELRRELGARARQVAETQFAWPRIVDQVEEVYRSVMERWKRRGRAGTEGERGLKAESREPRSEVGGQKSEVGGATEGERGPKAGGAGGWRRGGAGLT